METVGHVEIHKNLETGGLDQLMLNDGNWLLGDLDIFVDLTIVTTKTNERLSGFWGNNQRGRNWRFTFNVEIFVQTVKFFLGVGIKLKWKSPF